MATDSSTCSGLETGSASIPNQMGKVLRDAALDTGVLVVAALFILVNLLTDLLYFRIDPRIRFA